MRALAVILSSVCLTACGSGRLAWATGDDLLRTALFRSEVLDDEVEHITLVLSNSRFECELPEVDDPAVREEAVLDLLAAACRENARHVVIDLYKHPSSQNSLGSYLGNTLAGPGLLSPTRPKLARASYTGIEEVVLTLTDGFARTYTVTEEDSRPELGEGGQVRLTDDRGPLRGQFSFPDGQISGRFHAEPCADDASIFDALALGPALSCP